MSHWAGLDYSNCVSRRPYSQEAALAPKRRSKQCDAENKWCELLSGPSTYAVLQNAVDNATMGDWEAVRMLGADSIVLGRAALVTNKQLKLKVDMETSAKNAGIFHDNQSEDEKKRMLIYALYTYSLSYLYM